MSNKFFFFFFLFALHSAYYSQVENEKHIEVVNLKKTKKYRSKKDNPAYPIMQEVWKKKKNNGLLLYKDYQYSTYEKIDFSIDNIDSNYTKRKFFKGIDTILDKYKEQSTEYGNDVLPFFITENVMKTYGKNNPTKERIDLEATRISGLQDNQIVSKNIQSLFKDVDIYQNTINYLNIGFTSPASTEGFGVFHYNIVDTIEVNTQPCYVIKFVPKNPAALAFRGELYISKDKYDIVRVKMETNKNININFVNKIATDLEFDNLNDDTFLLTKNETTIAFAISDEADSKNIIASRTAYFKDFLFDQGITDEFLDKIVIPEDDLVRKDEKYWEQNRAEILNTRQKNIYKMFSELENHKRYKTITKLVESLGSGYIYLGSGIDYGNIFQSFGNNTIEGFRVRVGARTYFSKNDMWRIQGYTAYGFRDKTWKYGIEGKYMFNKVNRFMIGAGHKFDFLQLAGSLITDDGILTKSHITASIINFEKNTSLSSIRQNSLFMSIEPWRNVQLSFTATQQTIEAADPNQFNIKYHYNNQVLSSLNDSKVSFVISAKPGLEYSTYGIDRTELRALPNNPTIILKYTRGFKDIFNSQFNYNKLQFYYHQPLTIGNWGRLLSTFQAGHNFESTPLILQNVFPANQSFGTERGVFSLMNYYEFVADSYALTIVEHHFNGKILSQIPLIKKLKLKEIALFRAAVGSLRKGSVAMNAGDFALNAPEKPYYEYGFGLENIGWGNFRVLRLDFNWRGNYRHFDESRNFGVQVGLSVRF